MVESAFGHRGAELDTDRNKTERQKDSSGDEAWI